MPSSNNNILLEHCQMPKEDDSVDKRVLEEDREIKELRQAKKQERLEEKKHSSRKDSDNSQDSKYSL